jgi:hypothetical protein
MQYAAEEGPMQTACPSALRSTLPALLLLTACGPAIRSERDEAVPVPQGATWIWAEREPAPRSDLAVGMGDEMVRQRFERAITAAMAAHGFRQVTDPDAAHFLLSLGYVARSQQRGPGRGGVSIGIMGGWGVRRGWGGRPWGAYPGGWWGGWYDPWGWNWFMPMGMMTALYPMQGPVRPMGAREGELVAALRDRASGYIAWRGRVATDALATPHLSQERVQDIVDKLFRTLP